MWIDGRSLKRLGKMGTAGRVLMLDGSGERRLNGLGIEVMVREVCSVNQSMYR